MIAFDTFQQIWANVDIAMLCLVNSIPGSSLHKNIQNTVQKSKSDQLQAERNMF